MKTKSGVVRLLRTTTLISILIPILTSVGCTTAYDSAGRQIQSVDPGAAVAGAAVAGALGYAIGRNNNDNHDHYRNRRRHEGRNYYRPRYHHRRYH